MTRRTTFVLVSLSNLLGIAPSFPTREVCTKPGTVHYGTLGIESARQKQALERLDFVPVPEAIYRSTLPG